MYQERALADLVEEFMKYIYEPHFNHKALFLIEAKHILGTNYNAALCSEIYDRRILGRRN